MIREMPKGKPMDCKFMTKILSCRWLSAVGAEELVRLRNATLFFSESDPGLSPVVCAILEWLRSSPDAKS